MLTDTTFWIDLLTERQAGRRRPVHDFMTAHRTSAFYVSIITLGELAEGFAEHTHLDQFLRGVRILPLPRQVFWMGSRVQRLMRRSRLGENDTWIAATALLWGKRLGYSRRRIFTRSSAHSGSLRSFLTLSSLRRSATAQARPLASLPRVPNRSLRSPEELRPISDSPD